MSIDLAARLAEAAEGVERACRCYLTMSNDPESDVVEETNAVAEAAMAFVDARRAARDAGYTVVLLSAESIKAIRAALRAGLPPGGEALTRDLAAALETPLLARSPTEGA